MSAGDDSRRSRQDTDSALQVERDHTDRELLDRAAGLGDSADEVIQRARERARLVLELAREREDRVLDASDAASAVRARVADERRIADEVLAQEYADADAAVRDEGSLRRRAIMALLALEREAMDRTLSSERGDADRMVAVRDDVLAVVSHDLRNLLTGILARSAVVVLSHPQDAKLVRHVEEMQRTVGKMDKLLTDLLDVASMESGRMSVERSPMDLVAVVMEELRVHRLAAKAHSIDLTIRAPGSPIMVELDQARIGRVVMNVLANALKFTPAGGRIDVVVERQGNEACVSVRDTGPGIAADQLEAVFERFRRNDTHTRGYGLGLYIARAIVDAHDGRIWVESKLGEGSTFWIRLPAI